MGELFSYCVRYDGGAAPNPFWGVCTLVICKPRIRHTAQPGDWVVGTGSCRSPVGDLSGAVVYAMQVGQKVTMAKYDDWAAAECPGKRPDPAHPDPRRGVGDALYDFSFDPPRVRPGDHTEVHREHDLSGRYALLADRFVYFGRAAEPLPPGLRGLVKRGPGHRRVRDARLVQRFEQWLAGLGHPWGAMVDMPALWPAEAPIAVAIKRCRTPIQSLQQTPAAISVSARHGGQSRGRRC